MKIKIFVVNDFGINSFVLSDETGECIIVDAGYYTNQEQEMLVNYITSENLRPVMILCTHCHVDHVLGNYFVHEKYNTALAAHKADEFLLNHAVEMGNMFGLKTMPSPDITNYLDEGSIVTFGNSTLNAFHVPGHSPGSLAFYSEQDKFLISGDALFKGSIGRTDLPGGDYDILIKSIKEKLLSLPEETVVYPGHGDSTTIKLEHDTNPFFK